MQTQFMGCGAPLRKTSIFARGSWEHFPFYLVIAWSFIILFAHLGMKPLWGSEGRWAVIGRYMFQSGDFFNPMLGSSSYWDKPLVSYWQILPAAFVLGRVDELSARIPSALWALAMLYLTYDLAKRWLGKESALIAGTVLSTSFGYIFWGRNAQVEMTNATVILLILWYFFTRKASGTRAWVLVSALLMGIGANMKGPIAIVLPSFCILLLSAVKKDWEWFPPMRVLIPAAIILAVSFLIIPLTGCLLSSSWKPLDMIWRENMVRFFEPFDHKAPFYIYFYRIFDLAAPWSPFIPPVLLYYLTGGRYREAGVRDTLLVSSAIFLFLTLSGSRRSYYLLPILPFAAILIGDFLFRFFRRRLSSGFELAVKSIGIVIVIIFLIPFIYLVLKPDGLFNSIENFSACAAMLLACGGVMALSFARCYPFGTIAPIVVFWLVFVFVFIPWTADRPGNIRSQAKAISAMNRSIGFLNTDDAKLVFYLNKPYTVLSDLKQAHEWGNSSEGILITYDDIHDIFWEKIIDAESWRAFIHKGKSKAVSESGRIKTKTGNTKLKEENVPSNMLI